MRWIERYFARPQFLEVALFLIYQTDRGFLFERRLDQTDDLYGKIVIPGGKVEGSLEKNNLHRAARRECEEETGVNLSFWITLSQYVDIERQLHYFPYLLHGEMWGEMENREKRSKELIWIPYGVVIFELGQKESNIFALHSTRTIVREAVKKISNSIAS